MGRRKVEAPNSCANCRYLAWGKEEGFDLCRKTGDGVDWADKPHQVCDDHVRVEGDPRNPPREDLVTREAEAFTALEAAWRFHRQEDPQAIEDAVAALITARHAANTAGYVRVLVRKTALRELRAGLPGVRELAPLLVHDLEAGMKSL